MNYITAHSKTETQVLGIYDPKIDGPYAQWKAMSKNKYTIRVTAGIEDEKELVQYAELFNRTL